MTCRKWNASMHFLMQCHLLFILIDDLSSFILVHVTCCWFLSCLNATLLKFESMASNFIQPLMLLLLLLWNSDLIWDFFFINNFARGMYWKWWCVLQTSYFRLSLNTSAMQKFCINLLSLCFFFYNNLLSLFKSIV